MLTDKNRNYLWPCMWVSLVAQMVKNLSVMQETLVPSLSWEDPLENGMATHSSILAWRITWAEAAQAGLCPLSPQPQAWSHMWGS